MKSYLSIIILLISISGYSQTSKINIDELVSETQKSSSDQDIMNLIWWVPMEFWKAAMEADGTIPQSQLDEMIDILKPYTMFVVVDGKIGPFGGVTYTSLETIKENIVLVDNQKKHHYPIEHSELGSDIQIMISTFKPIFENMLGPMGENMHIFVFPDIDPTDNYRIANPYIIGNVTFSLKGEDYIWRTPLGSLLDQKVCPFDSERMNGAWTYCPWHGDKLKKLSE